MEGKHWFSLLWIASLACAWWAGQHLGGPASPEAADTLLAEENARLRERVAELERAREAEGPALEARGTAPGETPGPASTPGSTPSGSERGRASGPAPAGPVGKFDLAKIETPEELARAFLAYASAMLAKGREGHLELLAFIGSLGGKENENHFERIFARGGERAIPGALYPVMKFAINNEKQVMALTETFFEQAAENPQWFKDMDDDPFELFTEGIGTLAPAVADEKQMGRLRAYAKAILEQDEASQPDAIRRNRRDLERLLRLWAPPMQPEEILAKLQAGTLSEAEIMSLLPTLPPEAQRHVDLDRFLGPRIENGDYQAVRVLSRFQEIDPVTRERLDQRVLRGAGAEGGRVHGWFLQYYLGNTGRTKWVEMRTFFETGLGMEGKAAETFAQGVLNLRGPNAPDKEWVRWALGRFTISEGMAGQIRKRFGIQD